MWELSCFLLADAQTHHIPFHTLLHLLPCSTASMAQNSRGDELVQDFEIQAKVLTIFMFEDAVRQIAL
jgi:hypothetical protein